MGNKKYFAGAESERLMARKFLFFHFMTFVARRRGKSINSIKDLPEEVLMELRLLKE
jgi:hypothetical protein